MTVIVKVEDGKIEVLSEEQKDVYLPMGKKPNTQKEKTTNQSTNLTNEQTNTA